MANGGRSRLRISAFPERTTNVAQAVDGSLQIKRCPRCGGVMDVSTDRHSLDYQECAMEGITPDAWCNCG